MGNQGAKRAEPRFKVVICGGAGGIGQPLSLLMCLDERVKEVVVQDVTMAMIPAAGVAADLAHLETPAKVTHCAIDPNAPDVPSQLKPALAGAHLVLVPAGVPRKPGMSRDDLFSINANIARDIVLACSEACPEAVVALIVNPVNSIVPAMCEIYKSKGISPRKIVGVTTLDVVRANKFVSEINGKHVGDVAVPVVGGHAGKTILPLLSQVTPPIPDGKIRSLDQRIQDAGTEVVDAKGGKGSATLSMAYAGARLGKAVLSGLEGKPTEEYAYVALLEDAGNIAPGVLKGFKMPYFTTKVKFGKTGVEGVLPIGKLSNHERTRLDEAATQLQIEIEKGIQYAAKQR
eukprot:CAMPEP_0204394776 /NCGR_PEP_ID=MMETSP0469-20131031/63007_1 /ASSEMBLY_ACC=CAM_ASM_000384 /TAXON_ID=2969 /ORGANISM="Oxyrrhis marina" /LENGTH=345 /DNA_ID=CAMNT_0051388887 /DNA_START=8 /DNA_END=1045 /DNA_ORIENTATION=-